MLNSLRAAANNIFFRLLLGLIVLAFALWGIGDVIRGRNDFDLVKFRKLPSITLSQFYQAKKEAMVQIENSTREKLTTEMLEQMNIDRQVLSVLISRKMIQAWIDSHDIAISDEIIRDYVKKIPLFQDDKKHFNIDLLKNYIAKNSFSEEEFFEAFKVDIPNNFLQKIVKNSISTPKLFEDIVINYMSQIKSADYIKVNLSEKGNFNDISLSDKQVSAFYEQNKEMFKLPEERTISYIAINKDKISLNTEPTDEEKTKNLVDLTKNLEDAVASGENISEIAAKYKTEIKTFTGTYEALLKDATLNNFADQIFAMEQQELSYPVENANNNSIILFEIAHIKEGNIPALNDIKSSVVSVYLKKEYVTSNIKKLKEFESKINSENFNTISTQYGYNIANIEVARANESNILPREVTYTILNTATGSISPLVILEDNAYIIRVTNTKLDKKQSMLIRNTNLQNISNFFKSSFVDEVIAYFYSRNMPDVRMELLGGEG